MASYKIAEIEGIGEVYAAKLQPAGIKTVNDFLEKGRTCRHRLISAGQSPAEVFRPN